MGGSSMGGGGGGGGGGGTVGAVGSIISGIGQGIIGLQGLKGKFDKPCIDVNGKYATPRWLRRHPVEHWNCTRMGVPTTLPKGRRVTLLA